MEEKDVFCRIIALDKVEGLNCAVKTKTHF